MPRSFGPSNRSLFIRNVAEVTRSDDLRSLFGEFGHVTDVYIPLDYHSHRPRGFAYVQFDELRSAEEAVHNLDRMRLFGRELEVEFAQGDRKTPSEMRFKERGPPFRSGDRSSGRRNSSRRDSSRRHKSRSRSRERVAKSNRSRHRSRSRSRSPHRSTHRHRHHTHSRSRSKSNSRSKSRKGHENRHHSKSSRNKDSIEIKLENHTNNETHNESHSRDDRRDTKDSIQIQMSPSSIERTNGDKPYSGDESMDGNSQT